MRVKLNKHSISSNTTQGPANDDGNRSKKWYQKTGWIIALLMLFFPAGLYLMWRYTDWNKPAKVVISGFFLLCILLYKPAPKLMEIELTADTASVYDINENVQIQTKTNPANFTLPDKAFKSSGGNLQYSDTDISFSVDNDGNYRIWAEYNNIKSNVIKIKFEDKAAIAKAKEKEKTLAEEKAKKLAEAEAQRLAEEEARKQAEIAAQAEAQRQAEIAAQAEAQRQAQEQQTPETSATVYWTPNGEVYHSTSNCATLRRSKAVLSGTIAQSGKPRPCKVCH